MEIDRIVLQFYGCFALQVYETSHVTENYTLNILYLITSS